MYRNTREVYTDKVRIIFISLVDVPKEWDECDTEPLPPGYTFFPASGQFSQRQDDQARVLLLKKPEIKPDYLLFQEKGIKFVNHLSDSIIWRRMREPTLLSI